MAQEAQRRCRWVAVCASVAILCGGLLALSPSVEAASHQPVRDETPSYTINLESTPRPAAPSSVPDLPGFEHYRLYTTQFEKDGQTWHRLRMGFFASEGDARHVLEALRAEYPQAWVAKVSPGEAEVTGRPDTAPSADTAVSEVSAAVPEILTLKEAAEFLRVDPFVLKDMARRQAVPARRIGVYWRFSRSALRAWLAGAEVDTAELFAAAPTVSGALVKRVWGRPAVRNRASPCRPRRCLA